MLSVLISLRRLFKMAFTRVLYFDLRHLHLAVYDTRYLTCSCAIKDAVLTSWLWWSVDTCVYFENLRAALQISTKTVLAHENRLLYSDIDAECLLCSPAYVLTVIIIIITIILLLRGNKDFVFSNAEMIKNTGLPIFTCVVPGPYVQSICLCCWTENRYPTAPCLGFPVFWCQ